MAEASQNPLVSTARASDNSSTVQLHPLVLLTISDCITRHTLRQQKGPVVGAIIGQQNGQEITMEVAFQAKLKTNDAGEVVLDGEWFAKRLEDCKCPSFVLEVWAHNSTNTNITNSQRRSQGATARPRRLVHIGTSLRTRTPHPPDPLPHLRVLHRSAIAGTLPPRRCLLRSYCRRQAPTHAI
jgi:hypothetical protein